MKRVMIKFARIWVFAGIMWWLVLRTYPSCIAIPGLAHQFWTCDFLQLWLWQSCWAPKRALFAPSVHFVIWALICEAVMYCALFFIHISSLCKFLFHTTSVIVALALPAQTRAALSRQNQEQGPQLLSSMSHGTCLFSNTMPRSCSELV